MRKQWISVKCGLTRDPRHRSRMGEAIWLFLHILDRADWDTGTVFDWKDEAEAEAMAMPVRTLREHRRKLIDLGYIEAVQRQYSQDVVIRNWVNPREYSGKTYNRQGDSSMEPSADAQGDIQGDIQGDTQGDTQGYMQGYMQGSRNHVTPTSSSKIKDQTSTARPLSAQEVDEANAMVDAMLTPAPGDHYQNREKIPEPLLPYADVYHELTGQEPVKRVIHEWMHEFSAWQSEGIQPQHVRAAYREASGKFAILRPASLTNTAAAIRAKARVAATGSGPVDPMAHIEAARQLHAGGGAH